MRSFKKIYLFNLKGDSMKAFNILAVISLTMLVLFSGCVDESTDTPTGEVILPEDNTVEPVLTAEKGDTVKVHYLGTFEDGEVFDGSVDKDHAILRDPLGFEVGAGQMIPGFDAAVVGMKLEEEKTVTLAPEEAYGQKNDENIVPYPKEQLESQGFTPEVGLKLNANGMAVTVVEVNDENVMLDFNHPLAGKTLVFWIKMVEIVKAE
jgi:FKBP-type peptidyl-prolyl cis-trans isomerase 2